MIIEVSTQVLNFGRGIKSNCIQNLLHISIFEPIIIQEKLQTAKAVTVCVNGGRRIRHFVPHQGQQTSRKYKLFKYEV